MSFGRILYGLLTRIVGAFAAPIFRKRARDGKEDPNRLNERFARNLPPRLPGPLIWLHGASVGESQVLLGLGERLLAERPDLMLLYTSQTQTSASILATALPDRAIHQMAPVDTPAASRRFIQHWHPDLCIFAEGEIWPNLILAADRSGAKLALVNARMTQKSINGWTRWKGMARDLFYRFDLLLASDAATARGLESLLGRGVPESGNLKSALPPPSALPSDIAALSNSFVTDRQCWLAASTHAGEETLFLDAVSDEPHTCLIIAPRHPERGDDVEAIIKARGLTCARRSRHETATPETRILLADTIGEMGLWFSLADAVYLGGANATGVGGHNPLEPLLLGLPVATGPNSFNFQDMMLDLENQSLITVVETADELKAALVSAGTPNSDALLALKQAADEPMQTTLGYLRPLLPAEIRNR